MFILTPVHVNILYVRVIVHTPDERWPEKITFEAPCSLLCVCVCVDGSKRLSSSREEPGVTQLKGSLGAFSITILGIKTNLSLNSMKFCLGPY